MDRRSRSGRSARRSPASADAVAVHVGETQLGDGRAAPARVVNAGAVEGVVERLDRPAEPSPAPCRPRPTPSRRNTQTACPSRSSTSARGRAATRAARGHRSAGSWLRSNVIVAGDEPVSHGDPLRSMTCRARRAQLADPTESCRSHGNTLPKPCKHGRWIRPSRTAGHGSGPGSHDDVDQRGPPRSSAFFRIGARASACLRGSPVHPSIPPCGRSAARDRQIHGGEARPRAALPRYSTMFLSLRIR